MNQPYCSARSTLSWDLVVVQNSAIGILVVIRNSAVGIVVGIVVVIRNSGVGIVVGINRRTRFDNAPFVDV